MGAAKKGSKNPKPTAKARTQDWGWPKPKFYVLNLEADVGVKNETPIPAISLAKVEPARYITFLTFQQELPI